MVVALTLRSPARRFVGELRQKLAFVWPFLGPEEREHLSPLHSSGSGMGRLLAKMVVALGALHLLGLATGAGLGGPRGGRELLKSGPFEYSPARPSNLR